VTIGQLHVEGAAALAARPGLPDPRREARWLLARALGCTEEWLLAHDGTVAPPSVERTYRKWVSRRAAGEPAHYIVGSCPFWGRQFTVTPAVLIPRPETELIVECALKLPRPAPPQLLDVGTGAGCLAITLALEIPDVRVVATDLSLSALQVAAGNARLHHASVRFVAGDLAAHISGSFGLVLANLPYVPDRDIAGLPVEVRAHEPHVALAGGEEGTDLLSGLLADLPRLLAPGGHALLEMGQSQRALLEDSIGQLGLAEVQRGLDHAGIERVLVLRRP
jgi:release factor glutamine methyltransferase